MSPHSRIELGLGAPGQDPGPPPPQKAGLPRFWIAILGLVILAALAGGYSLYRLEAGGIRKERIDDLKSIADLKIGQLAQWRKERLGDARVIASSPFNRSVVTQLLASPGNDRAKADILARMEVFTGSFGYHDLILAAPDGRRLVSARPDTPPFDDYTRTLIAQVFASGRMVFGDFHRSPVSKRVYLDILTPVLSLDGRTLAVMILRTDPDQYLYPLIQSWPTHSRTAETLIVRREGDRVLFLNKIRHRPDPALTITEPVTNLALPAVQAVLGREGYFEGKDYRAAKVVAHLQAIPQTPWFMVAKVDAAEIYAEVRYHGLVILLFVALFIFLTVVLAAFAFSFRQRNLYAALYESEKERRAGAEISRVTLYSIGDGVIGTDTEGRVRQMNPVAETLTGWTEAEALGKPITEVFRIVNEETRAEVENPIVRVLREGVIVGLANHTLLIAKDGAERPIADAGAPIRDEQGQTSGVVLVFRDQTAERQAEKALAEQRALLEAILDQAVDGIMVCDTQGRLTFINKAASDSNGQVPGDLVDGPNRLEMYHSNGRPFQPQEMLLYRALRGETVRGVERHSVTADGRSIWTLSSAAPVKNERGEVIAAVSIHTNINARKQLEEKLKRANEELEGRVRQRTEEVVSERQRLYGVLDTLPAYVVLLDQDYCVPFANKYFRERFGESNGRRCYDYLFHNDAPCEGCESYKVMATKAPHRWDWTGPDGRDYDVYDFPFFAADGSMLILEMGMDVTERNRAEEQLKKHQEHLEELVRERSAELAEKEARLSSIYASMADGLVLHEIVYDDSGKAVDYVITEVNPAFEKITGMAGSAAVGQKASTLYGAGEPPYLDIYARTAATGESASFETYFPPMEKHFSISVFSPGRGKFATVFQDITERKRSEEERETVVEFLHLMNKSQSSEDLIRAATEFLQRKSGCEAVGVRLKRGQDYPYWQTRGFPEEFIVLENSLCARDGMGRPILESSGKPVLECLCGSVISGRFDPAQAFFTAKGSFWTNSTTALLATTPEADLPARIRGRCNTEGYESLGLVALRVGEERLGLLQLNDKRPGRFTLETIALWERLADYLAVTLSKFEAEAALRQSREDLDRAQAVGQIGSWRLDVRQNVLTWSEENRRLFGVPEGTPMTYETFLESVHPDDRRYVDDKWQAGLRGEPYDLEHRIVADGRVKWVREKAYLEFDDARQLLGGFGITQDITERKQSMEELRRHRDELEMLVKERSEQLYLSEQRLARESAAVAEIAGEMLSGRLSDEETETQVLNACLEATGSLYGMIGRVNERGTFDVTSYTSRTLSDCAFPEAQAWETTTNMNIRGIWGWPLLHAEPLVCNDLEQHPDRVGLPEGHVPIEAYLGVPVKVEGQVVGMIAVANRPGGYTEADVGILTRLVDVMVVSRRHRVLMAEAQATSAELERRVRERTAQLETANREMESFSYTVSHDLRAPLRSMDGFSGALLSKYMEQLDEQGRHFLERIQAASRRMGQLINDLLGLSQVSRHELILRPVDLTAMARQTAFGLQSQDPERLAEFVIAEGMISEGDTRLLHVALENLMGNAWKFTEGRSPARIEVGMARQDGGHAYFVRDNGVGFDMTYADKLFGPFQRLHAVHEFPGMGIGLATVQRIIGRHGGRIWPEAAEGQGATFYFTLWDDPGLPTPAHKEADRQS